MPKTRKTAREKLETGELQVVDSPQGRMLIPKPLDVDALVRRIPRGKLATVSQIRERLAKDVHVDLSCPLTTGIFLRIIAEAAEEDLMQGEIEITPYWRAIKNDGSLNEKFPGGVEAQASRLREEGHAVELGKGKK
ncbi:MAG: MGMT family protein, partial [Chloroflexi bacterium]|nr:MGMT family protein [Chloroflexota bacterium]